MVHYLQSLSKQTSKKEVFHMAQKDQDCQEASSCSRSSCEGCPEHEKEAHGPQKFPQNPGSFVKHVIGVVSGKGEPVTESESLTPTLPVRPSRRCMD